MSCLTFTPFFKLLLMKPIKSFHVNCKWSSVEGLSSNFSFKSQLLSYVKHQRASSDLEAEVQFIVTIESLMACCNLTINRQTPASSVMDKILKGSHRTPTIRLGQNPENKSLNAICQTFLSHIRWRYLVLAVGQSWLEGRHIWWYTKCQSPISSCHDWVLQVGWVAIMAFLRLALGHSDDLACHFTAPRGHTHGPSFKRLNPWSWSYR